MAVVILALWSLSSPIVGGPCQRTLCMAGAFSRTDGANPSLARICEGAPGIIRDCVGARCQSMFHFAAVERAREAMVASLDADGDGQVGAGDPATRLCLVGYSWGAVNAAEAARRLLEDRRVAPSRRTITRLILLDPFAPLVREVRIPAGVEAAWSFRQAHSPAHDCSGRSPLGPFKGVPLRCDDGRCVDGVVSSPERRLGHCGVVRASARAVRRLLMGARIED